MFTPSSVAFHARVTILIWSQIPFISDKCPLARLGEHQDHGHHNHHP